MQTSLVRVYGSHGRCDSLPIELVPPVHLPPDGARDAGELPLTTFMARDLLCVRPELDIARVVELMVGKHVGCLPVVDARGRPTGIITKFDVVEQLDAAMRLRRVGEPLPEDIAACTAEDVMMPLALTLDQYATLAHAAALMVSEDTHHVLVVDSVGTLVGVVSSRDIVRWVAQHP